MSARSEACIASIIANSFKDYHVKGFDYLCLLRTPQVTDKFYFFGDDIAELPEVVHPHDHRYDFHTFVLAGEMTNSVFVEHPHGHPYECFDYRTPLNGGNGFTWRREAKLRRAVEIRYTPGESYEMGANELHTIRILQPGTVLRVLQYADRVPIDQPTRTFTSSKEPISLAGLYSRFTADEVTDRLATLGDLLTRAFFNLPEFTNPNAEKDL